MYINGYIRIQGHSFKKKLNKKIIFRVCDADYLHHTLKNDKNIYRDSLDFM